MSTSFYFFEYLLGPLPAPSVLRLAMLQGFSLTLLFPLPELSFLFPFFSFQL
nr:MAG TPA: hypothetical protein [Caudoviricetes sp.]